MTNGVSAIDKRTSLPTALQLESGIPWGAHAIILRLNLTNKPGKLGEVASAIGSVGGSIGAIDALEITSKVVTRDISIAVSDGQHAQRVVEAIRAVPGIKVVFVSNPIFLAHLGGKIEVAPKKPLKTRADLSTYYTPGVAEVSLPLHDDPQKMFSLTMKGTTVAVLTDGP